MKSGPTKIYNKAKFFHRHGKHKGRGLAALVLGKMWRRRRAPVEPVDLKRTARI